MFSFHAECMGTVFVFQIEDELSDFELGRLCESAMEIIQDADDRFSLYRDDSELSRLKSNTLPWASASSQQQLIKSMAGFWRDQTQGFFDAKTDEDYDPSGIVKTWAAQNAVNFLEANGISRFTLNAGGDIYLTGNFQNAILGRVGVSKLVSITHEDSGAALILDLNDTELKAVCTSGTTERGEHIWRSNDEFVQATVIGPDLVEADVWATALIAGGRKALEVLEGSGGNLQAVMFDRDGKSLQTSGVSKLVWSE
jgi:thiamine biosynthesis lipoprotein